MNAIKWPSGSFKNFESKFKMLNQRASIFSSTQSHSNASLFYQKQRLMKRRKNRTQTSPISFVDLLNCQLVDKEILLLLRQYLFRRRLTIAFSSTIIVLISLNTLFLTVHLYDCRTFNLCSVDDEESKPFFFWVLIGLNLSLTTVLVFIVLHLKHCKQYYAENLVRLTTRTLQPDKHRPSSEDAGSEAGHANNRTFHSPNSLQPSHQSKTLKTFNVPSIAVVHFDPDVNIAKTDLTHLNRRTCYENLTFESDLGIELKEMKGPTHSGVDAKQSHPVWIKSSNLVVYTIQCIRFLRKESDGQTDERVSNGWQFHANLENNKRCS